MPTYPLLSAFIGIMQIFDAWVLLKNNNAVGWTTVVLSTIEFLWVIVSIVMIFKAKDRATRLLAAVFVAYYIGIIGLLMILGTDQPTIPLWGIMAGGIFGMAFAVGSFMVYQAKRLRAD